MIFNKIFFTFLFISSFTFCNSKDEILILEKGKKKEFIAINKELKVCFDENSNVCVLGKLIKISEEKILLKKDYNDDIIEIPINKITRIIVSDRDGVHRVTKSLLTGCLIGFIAPTVIILNGNLKTHYKVILPIILTLPSSIVSGTVSSKIVSKLTFEKEYVINQKKWKIVEIKNRNYY